MTTARKCAWVTLLTRPSYLGGVIILAHTLKKYGTKYPLIVEYTDTLPSNCVAALKSEGRASNLLIVRHVEALLPRENVNVVAERFTDTWTKLRVFELVEYDTIVFIDADVMIMRNMDELFDFKLPARDWLAANHACVCNKDSDPWAPPDWKTENCGYTPTKHPHALTHPTPVTKDSRPTYHLLNSGLFIFHPGAELWDSMLNFFNTTPLLSTFSFPDQDFLAEFFRYKWVSIGWQFNALKTMRYWHPDMWRDDEVRGLHYIVDKPWAARVPEDGIAGYLGRDGVTHQWWWDEYEDWERSTRERGDVETLELVRDHVAKPLGERQEADNEELRSLAGKSAQKRKNPAEKGHGPVVHPGRESVAKGHGKVSG
ncbi:MAG: hypothetical protein M1827_000466 [Pycnora praestabilis]|nr:MAG: hypothetical protein M1827_000466 [Pycnora praestabilis]